MMRYGWERSSVLARFSGQTMAVLRKDLLIEVRDRTAINAVLLFAVTSLVVVGYSVGVGRLDPGSQASLMWIILLFAAFSGLSRSFTHEEDTGTAMALRLCADPAAVYAGKLAYTCLVVCLMAVLMVPLCIVVLSLSVPRPLELVAVVVAGCLGLSAGATIIAAVVARAGGRGAMFGAIGLPVMLPLLLAVVPATRDAMLTDVPSSAIWRVVVGLLSYSVMTITASALLFPHLWED